MSAFSEVLNYVRANGESTTNDVCAGLNHLDMRTVQRALERLFAVGQIKRKPCGRMYMYFTDEPSASTGNRLLAELATKALELEEKGLLRRAASVWLEAFDGAQTIQARACYAQRRARCLAGMTRGITDTAGDRWNETWVGGGV